MSQLETRVKGNNSTSEVVVLHTVETGVLNHTFKVLLQKKKSKRNDSPTVNPQSDTATHRVVFGIK